MTQLQVEHKTTLTFINHPNMGAYMRLPRGKWLLPLFATMLGVVWVCCDFLKVKPVKHGLPSPEPVTDLQSKSQVVEGRRRSPKAPWPAAQGHGWVKTRPLKMKYKAAPPGSWFTNKP